MSGSPREICQVLSSYDGAWSQLTPSGALPGGRYELTAIYDPLRDQMVIFGGEGSTTGNDTWALSLAGAPTWSLLTPSGPLPPARYGHTAFYDPLRDRMIIFGGYGGYASGVLNDTWALSLAGTPAWSQLTPSGTLPPARYHHTAVYDPVGDRMILFGGDNYQYLGYLNDTWALSLAGTPAWSQLTPSGTLPPARYGHTAIYDPMRNRMVIFGGDAGFSYGYLNDTWALSLTGAPAWSQLTPSGTLPRARWAHRAIYDPVRDRMVVFGGQNSSDQAYNETWALTLPGMPAWSQLTPSGTLPPVRYFHTAIYDPVRDRMVIFGGEISYGIGYNDTWALQWPCLAACSSPTVRCVPCEYPTISMAMTSAVPGDTVLVFAGTYQDSSVYVTPGVKLLAWPGSFPPVITAGHGPLFLMSGGADSSTVIRGLVLDGQGTASIGIQSSNAAGIVDGNQIRNMQQAIRVRGGALDITGNLITGSQAGIAISRQSLALISGNTISGLVGTGISSDSSASLICLNEISGCDIGVSCSGWPQPVVGGNLSYANGILNNRTWNLQNATGDTLSALCNYWGTVDSAQIALKLSGPVKFIPFTDAERDTCWNPTSVPLAGSSEEIGQSGFFLDSPTPNPSGGGIDIRYRIPMVGLTSLSIYDVRGRLVRQLVQGKLPAGDHAASWDGKDDRGTDALPGVYFYRLETTGRSETRKGLLVR